MERLRPDAASGLPRRGRPVRRAATILLLALPAAASGGEPWHGVWAADPAWCAYAGLIGSHDPAPVEFSAGRIRGLETDCRVTGVAADRDFAFHVVTSECSGEGMTWRQVDVLMMAGDGAMWRWTGGGEPIRLVRCEGG